MDEVVVSYILMYIFLFFFLDRIPYTVLVSFSVKYDKTSSRTVSEVNFSLHLVFSEIFVNILGDTI